MRSLRTRALAVATAVALLTLALGAGVASAGGPRDHNNAENTFTKWITGAGPAPYVATMGGIVGGDVGDGTFSGYVVTKTLTATGAVIDAIYQFHGSRHSFTAPVHVVQTGLNAVVTGQITDGWLAGTIVEGQYTQGTCEQAPGVFGTCFQGTLDILRGSGPQAFHLDKTCSEDASEPLGFFCTVQHSDFPWILAGTEIHYDVGPADNAQTATITIANGSTTGVCTWSSDVDAICVFPVGTGRQIGRA